MSLSQVIDYYTGFVKETAFVVCRIDQAKVGMCTITGQATVCHGVRIL
jgi:hypothetical protein